MPDIMISPNIKERDMEHCDEKGEIFRRQITACKNQVYIRKALSLEMIIQHRFNLI
jgi:hypothetical protein